MKKLEGYNKVFRIWHPKGGVQASSLWNSLSLRRWCRWWWCARRTERLPRGTSRWWWWWSHTSRKTLWICRSATSSTAQLSGSWQCWTLLPRPSHSTSHYDRDNDDDRDDDDDDPIPSTIKWHFLFGKRKRALFPFLLDKRWTIVSGQFWINSWARWCRWFSLNEKISIIAILLKPVHCHHRKQGLFQFKPTCSWDFVAFGAEANRLSSYDDIVVVKGIPPTDIVMGLWENLFLKGQRVITVQPHKIDHQFRSRQRQGTQVPNLRDCYISVIFNKSDHSCQIVGMRYMINKSNEKKWSCLEYPKTQKKEEKEKDAIVNVNAKHFYSLSLQPIDNSTHVENVSRWLGLYEKISIARGGKNRKGGTAWWMLRCYGILTRDRTIDITREAGIEFVI